MRSLLRRAAIWTSIVVVTLGAGPASVDDRIARVERQLNLPQLMKQHHVPGISVAVIENFKTVWAKGYGVTEKGGSVRVTRKPYFSPARSVNRWRR